MHVLCYFVDSRIRRSQITTLCLFVTHGFPQKTLFSIYKLYTTCWLHLVFLIRCKHNIYTNELTSLRIKLHLRIEGTTRQCIVGVSGCGIIKIQTSQQSRYLQKQICKFHNKPRQICLLCTEIRQNRSQANNDKMITLLHNLYYTVLIHNSITVKQNEGKEKVCKNGIQ